MGASDRLHNAVAAFSIGRCTVLVEADGWLAVHRPDLFRGTTAVSASRNINAMTKFVLSRDGVVVAEFTDNLPKWARGSDPAVLLAPLAAMGITDPAALDATRGRLDDLELLCRLAGIRPTLDDVGVPVLGTVLAAPTGEEMGRMMSRPR